MSRNLHFSLSSLLLIEVRSLSGLSGRQAVVEEKVLFSLFRSYCGGEVVWNCYSISEQKQSFPKKFSCCGPNSWRRPVGHVASAPCRGGCGYWKGSCTELSGQWNVRSEGKPGKWIGIDLNTWTRERNPSLQKAHLVFSLLCLLVSSLTNHLLMWNVYNS